MVSAYTRYNGTSEYTEFKGLANDPRPLNAKEGDFFQELDTDTTYRYDGSYWVLVPSYPFSNGSGAGAGYEQILIVHELHTDTETGGNEFITHYNEGVAGRVIEWWGNKIDEKGEPVSPMFNIWYFDDPSSLFIKFVPVEVEMRDGSIVMSVVSTGSVTTITGQITFSNADGYEVVEYTGDTDEQIATEPIQQ